MLPTVPIIERRPADLSHSVDRRHNRSQCATGQIHIGQAVLNLKGTLDFFVENTFNYPTLAEAYKIAALDAWNRMPQG